MNSLPIEIFTDIFNFLPYTETYRFRSVCKRWKRQCEYALFSNFRSNQYYIKASVFASGKRVINEIQLVPHSYDAQNQVIQFKPTDSSGVLIDPDTTQASMSILFSEWSKRKNDKVPDTTTTLGPLDLALLAFHFDYNYFESRQYPVVLQSHHQELRYLGDRGMTMVYFNSLKDGTTRLCIQSLYVHLSWLIAGFFPNTNVPQPLYEQRQSVLADHLAAHGIRDFYPYSEHALKCILSQDNELAPVEEPSRLEQIERKLSQLGVDPRVLWKYSFIKAMILNPELPFCQDDVERVQRSEQDWQKKRVNLLKNMNYV
jgi:hypothetical protein